MGNKINARDWRFEVSVDPTATTPVWAAVAGLTSFSLNPAENEESADTTTFQSAGQSESKAMQRGASLSLEGLDDRTSANVKDAGQLACDQLAALLGDASVGGVRFRHVTDTTWVVWRAWASKAEVGGGTNDTTSWGCSFTRSGPATSAAV